MHRSPNHGGAGFKLTCASSRIMNTDQTAHALIFDFGGVLMDWNPLYLYGKLFNGDEQAAAHFLQEIHFSEWNLRQDAGRPFAEGVAEWCARYPHYSDLIRAYDARWEESIGGPIEPTVEVLRELHLAGRELHGLSNWSAEKFYQVRDRYPFFRWFRSILLSGEVRINKPDPAIFQVLLQRIGRAASDCLLIDDSAKNIEVARGLGFETIHFLSAQQLRAELKQRRLL